MKEIIKGKVKTVYETDNPNQVLIKYHDRVTAGNGEKEANPPNKGAINCQISELLFKQLESNKHISTHYIECPTVDTMLCKKVTVWPLEVVVRNFAAGSIVRETPLEAGQKFHEPIVEFYLKDDSKNDPLLNEPRLRMMGYPYEIFVHKALLINKELKKIFQLLRLDLIDFKLEFGYTSNGNFLLVDEISPDSMRLWKSGSMESMDKDLFRKGTGDIVEAYNEILINLQQFF